MTSLGCEMSVMCVQGYQRLEFLGDAVLDLLMTRYYFTTYRCPQPSHPTLSPILHALKLGCPLPVPCLLPVSNAAAMGRVMKSVEKLHCWACYTCNHSKAPESQDIP